MECTPAYRGIEIFIQVEQTSRKVLVLLLFLSTNLMLLYNGRLNTLLYVASHGSVV